MLEGLLVRRRGDDEVRRTRPAELPPLEPELAAAPPRPNVWTWGDRDTHGVYLACLKGWTAHKAWVVRVDEISDGEGPDFAAWLAYGAAGEVHQLYRKFSFDAQHWSTGDPRHHDWFTNTLQAGRAVTVLTSPKVTFRKGWMLYGSTNALVEIGGEPTWAADREL